ncbi:hypothetical protein [Acetobacter sp. UBA5411]|uniref:hypothetical protein n=1 Tax=Acetobacter sp. UBA5411 TaxID=1945905 RepID=UPI0025C5B0AD|nr:hypothetical protein [Acetobacter sp. UBA5411]
MTEYFIVDVREEFRGKYITLWRPDNAGYCWPIPWAGRYSQMQILENHEYYTTKRFSKNAPNFEGHAFERYPVACDIVTRLVETPERGDIDGDVGPVIRNTKKNRDYLLRHRFRRPITDEVTA